MGNTDYMSSTSNTDSDTQQEAAAATLLRGERQLPLLSSPPAAAALLGAEDEVLEALSDLCGSSATGYVDLEGSGAEWFRAGGGVRQSPVAV
jgi:hypothetical protein